MKKVKLLVLMLTVMSSVAIYSCGGSKQEPAPQTTTEQPAAEQAPVDSTAQPPAQE